MRGVAAARRLLAFNHPNAAGQHRPYREIRWVMPQAQCAPAFVRARFGLTQDLSDIGGNLVLQVCHTVALGLSAKLPSKPFDSEGFDEQIVAILMRLLHNYRQNPPNQRVSMV
jgi:hypothetical protein